MSLLVWLEREVAFFLFGLHLANFLFQRRLLAVDGEY